MVSHQGGHANIKAVAGSGKTTSLIGAIANTFSDAPQTRMLIIMYGKKAKLEFDRKLQKLTLPASINKAELVYTYHGMGLRVYRALYRQKLLSINPDQSPMPQAMVDTKLKELLLRLVGEDDTHEIYANQCAWVEAASQFVELTKCHTHGPEHTFAQHHYPDKFAIFIKLFHQFEAWRLKTRKITFSDMLYDPCLLFQQRPDAARFFGGYYDVIALDEYQDTNQIQHNLLQVLHGGSGSVMAIGDCDQTIFEYRGSDPRFILQYFYDDFPGAVTYTLPDTFRYGHKLALLANHLISHNKQRDDTLCLSHKSAPPTDIHWLKVDDYAEETLTVVKKQLRNGAKPADIAILTRVWAISAAIELLFLTEGIPYSSQGKGTVFSRRVLWPLLEVLSLAAGEFPDYTDERRKQAFACILAKPFMYLKKEILDEMATTLANASSDYAEVLLECITDDLKKGQQRNIQQRAKGLMVAEKRSRNAGELLQQYIDIVDYDEGLETAGFSHQQIDEQQKTVRAFCKFVTHLNRSPKETLAYIRTLKDQHQQSAHTGGVTLTTFHASKDLSGHM